MPFHLVVGDSTVVKSSGCREPRGPGADDEGFRCDIDGHVVTLPTTAPVAVGVRSTAHEVSHMRNAGAPRVGTVTARVFQDRRAAGRALADVLVAQEHTGDSGRADPIVLALPRGGVPVAVEVAAALHAPWDVLVVRKIGAPDQPELAIGAVGEGGVEVRNSTTQGLYSEPEFQAAAQRERARVASQVETLRGGRPMIDITGRTVIIVDDGLATGTTMAAAVSVVRAAGAHHVIVAVPVGSLQAVSWMRRYADAVVCPSVPTAFIAVGQHYERFAQVSDDEVIEYVRAR